MFLTETFLPRTDGIVTRLKQTIRELRYVGDEVFILAPSMPGLPNSYEGAHVASITSVPFPLYHNFYLALPVLSPEVSARVRTFRPELIHMVNPVFSGLVAWYYARRYRLPLIASYHTNVSQYSAKYNFGWLEKVFPGYLRLIHKRAALNLCTSQTVQVMLRTWGFPHVELWKPGVDTHLFRPRPFSHAWRTRLTSGNPGATILLSVGRLAVEKGLPKILSVLPHLSNCHVAFVGDGPLADALKRSATGLPVTFLGSLYHEDLAMAYAAADIFVFPSATETLGLVAIEAMSAGLPVVGARRGGIPDIVVDGETGLLFDPDDTEDFVRALHYLVSHPAERQRMGARARLHTESWGWAATTADLRQQYTTILHSHQMAFVMDEDSHPSKIKL
jgi:glycosyltransferase involved in cell wall biosynthesis